MRKSAWVVVKFLILSLISNDKKNPWKRKDFKHPQTRYSPPGSNIAVTHNMYNSISGSSLCEDGKYLNCQSPIKMNIFICKQTMFSHMKVEDMMCVRLGSDRFVVHKQWGVQNPVFKVNQTVSSSLVLHPKNANCFSKLVLNWTPFEEPTGFTLNWF